MLVIKELTVSGTRCILTQNSRWICVGICLRAEWTLPYNSTQPIFTARKRSLQRLCFYTCLSVILFTWGRVPGQVHPRAGTPLRQIHPHGRYTPLAMYAGIWSTSGRYASYWNAFLFIGLFTGLGVRQCEHTITIHPLYQSIYWILIALKFGWSFQRRCKLWFWWVKLNITYGILFIQKLHPWENN